MPPPRNSAHEPRGQVTVLLDESVLHQSCGGDNDFARELFEEYQQRVLELLDSIKASVASSKLDDIRKAAHELKGSSLTLGAVEMAQISRTMEDGCRNGEVQDLPQWIVTMEERATELFAHLKQVGYL